jgi:hypothetical protein
VVKDTANVTAVFLATDSSPVNCPSTALRNAPTAEITRITVTRTEVLLVMSDIAAVIPQSLQLKKQVTLNQAVYVTREAVVTVLGSLCNQRGDSDSIRPFM